MRYCKTKEPMGKGGWELEEASEGKNLRNIA
jgi:hypothetical protein